jgi:hypothetical protein
MRLGDAVAKEIEPVQRDHGFDFARVGDDALDGDGSGARFRG